MKVYVSGPMTGYVEHNFPAFHRAAEHLRSLGYDVVSPAELDDPAATHEELAKIPHWWFLRRDLRVLLDCDLIYLLPGWRWSKGATLEAEVAKGTGIMRLTEHDDDLWRTFEGEPLPTEEPETEHPLFCNEGHVVRLTTDRREVGKTLDHTTCEPLPAKTCGATQGPVPKLGGQIFTCVKDEGHDLPHEDADGSWWEPDANPPVTGEKPIPPNAIDLATDRHRTHPLYLTGSSAAEVAAGVREVLAMTGVALRRRD